VGPWVIPPLSDLATIVPLPTGWLALCVGRSARRTGLEEMNEASDDFRDSRSMT
jgi:hypothetical protein